MSNEADYEGVRPACISSARVNSKLKGLTPTPKARVIRLKGVRLLGVTLSSVESSSDDERQFALDL